MADDDVFAQFMSEVAEAEAEAKAEEPPPADKAPPPTAPPPAPAPIPQEVKRAQATVLSAAPQKPTTQVEEPMGPPIPTPPPTTLLGKFYKQQGGYSLADSKLTEDQIAKVKEVLLQGQARAPPQQSLVKQLESVAGKGVPRQAAGQKWVDDTLSDWPENDYRIFVGDLGNEVNDDALCKAFQKYPSFNKARVVRDRRTNKSRGYGFVSLQNGEDFARCMREMQGKYVGNRPVKLRKSNWDDRTDNDPKRKKDMKRKAKGPPKPDYKRKHVLHI